ncbi:MAG: PCMD domain-containing protein [Muribaculaceae bacterium]|nr:PCMD domain-containing protein [Muribaculaceae bacterium]
MKNFLFSALVLALGLSSCIKNDLPYPRIEQYITAIAAEGEIKEAVIDDANFTATVYLDETVDIQSVVFTEFRISEGATADPDLAQGAYDLSSPIVVTLSLYQDYDWIVSAQQDIERYFTIAGQIGESAIDVVGRRIIVKVPETADLSNLTLTSIKLGPEGLTTLSPDLVPGPIDLSRPLSVAVTAWGRTQDWTIYAEKTELTVQTTSLDAWSEVIWAYGNCLDTMKGGFRYRQEGSDVWTDVPDSEITQTGGAFSARIAHLTPLTTYYVQALGTNSDGSVDEGNEMSATTQPTEVLPDGSFDQWWLNGRIWCPWNEGGVRFWDTGNTGAATLGQSNVQPSDDTPTGTGKSAKLETRFIGIGSLGKLGAGSIYTGTFAKVDGTNGILDFGRPWTVRPTKLKGYFKYTTAPINYASTEYKYLLDRPDSCHIYVAMTDWTEPYQIRTNPNNRHLFDASSPEIIAYGELIRGSNTDGWQEFEIELQYRSTTRVPRYIQITCAASKYGDFFTGGAGATLYVDDFTLHYDY